MTGPTAGADRTLPCGRTVGALLALVVDGGLEPADSDLAGHASTCQYCKAELAALDRRWDAVRGAASAPVPVPDGLVTRMLATVRGMRTQFSSPAAELEQTGGRLTVSTRAVLTLSRQLAVEAAGELPGVHLRGLSGDSDGLRVQIAVRYGVPAVRVAESLRAALTAKLAEALDSAAPEVSVEIADVLPPRPGIGLTTFE